ncbi:TPA: Thivi_2564 family membrane protein [Legionella anisa]
MLRINDLIMAVFSIFLLLAVNQYIPLANLINLLFNCLLIVITVIYIMQFLNLIKPILPSPKIFK